MVAIPSRHRSLVLLTGVIVLQILALAVQIKATDSQGDQTSLIRSWTVGAVSPFERAGAWCVDKVRGTWRHYFALSATAKENERLQQENRDLKLQIHDLQSKAQEGERLAALLHFRDSHQEVKMVPARVIGNSADNGQVIYVDRGRRDGLKKNMGVITAEGVVGKVTDVYGDTSQIQLLTDKESGAGAMLAGTRVQSPVGGTGEPLLSMKYVPSDDEVNVGDLVVTNGMDQIFPKDLPVGTVTEVKPGTPFKLVRVRPAAKLERLEEVIVLLGIEPLNLKKDPDAADSGAPAKGGTSNASKPVTEKAAAPQAARP